MNHRHSLFTLAVAAAAVVLSPTKGYAASHHRTFSELAAASDKVLIGAVGLKQSYWGDDGRIYSDFVVSPDVTIQGAEDGAVVVRIPGGTVGDTTMTVSDGAELPEGERVVLFLHREGDHFEVTGRAVGAVSVSSESAGDAVESAFRHVEAKSGRRLAFKRDLAGSALRQSDPIGNAAAQQATAVQTGCYSVDGSKWGTTSAAYRIGTSIPSTWPVSIDAAAATWSNAGAAFKLVNDPNSTNELSYVDLVAKYGSSYSNTFAVTTTWTSGSRGQITKATIEINTKWTWSTSGEANKADVQNILTHEFGHWMRLLDIYSPSTCSEVTMFGTAGLGETKKRTLEPDDISGLKSLYGSSGTTPPVGTPALVSPSNGATQVPTNTTLTWSAVSGATSCDLYFGTSPSPGLIATVAGTSYPTSALAAGTTYYWRVVAKNSTSSASSAVWSFTTAPQSQSSNVPVLLTPANGATISGSSTVMQWTAVTGATSYDLYVGTSSSPAYIGTVNGTAVRISGFPSGYTFYWKVAVHSSTASSTVWSFLVQ